MGGTVPGHKRLWYHPGTEMARPIRVLTVATALLGMALLGKALSAQERPGVHYETVQPILEAVCYECHG